MSRLSTPEGRLTGECVDGADEQTREQLLYMVVLLNQIHAENQWVFHQLIDPLASLSSLASDGMAVGTIIAKLGLAIENEQRRIGIDRASQFLESAHDRLTEERRRSKGRKKGNLIRVQFHCGPVVADSRGRP